MDGPLSEFALEFYRAILTEKKGNIVFSPWSILNGFAMVLLGAKGKTKEEMLQVLRFKELITAAPYDQQDIVVHQHLKQVNENLKKACTSNVSFDGANKIWISEGFQVLESYSSLLNDYYQIDVGAVDFVNNSSAAIKEINKWVETQTHKKIVNLFPDGSLDAMTRLALANAIHFKGLWDIPFDKTKTKRSDFYITENDCVKVDMMFVKGDFSMFFDESLGSMIVELPYKENRFSMLLIVPNKKSGYKDVEMKLTVDIMKTWELRPSRIKVHVHVPKFRLAQDISLKDTLTNMGLKEVFSEQNADLSNISGARDLFVACAFHKAFVEVEESGTEAAAATGIAVNCRSMPMQIRADRPFLFAIRENSHHSVLFFGKVMDPSV